MGHHSRARAAAAGDGAEGPDRKNRSAHGCARGWQRHVVRDGPEKPDAVLDEADTVVDLAEGMKCAIDPKSLMFLYGMQLDYSDELIGGGFSFQNPNAEETWHAATHASIAAASFLLCSQVSCNPLVVLWQCGCARAGHLSSHLCLRIPRWRLSCVASAMLQHDRRTRRIAWP